MKHNIPFVTIVLVAVNVIVFFVMQSRGLVSTEGIFNYGGANYEKIVGGEWWRLLTSCFIHFNFEHLFFNMFSLFAIGSAIEPGGRIRFSVVYFVSGILGSVVSIYANHQMGVTVVSAGASGAICGLVGYYIIRMIFESGRVSFQTLLRPLIAVVIVVGYGFTSGVDQAAHIGGMLVGAIVGLVFCLGKR